MSLELSSTGASGMSSQLPASTSSKSLILRSGHRVLTFSVAFRSPAQSSQLLVVYIMAKR